MPDTRAHRGAHPDDARDFAEPVHALLVQATGDLSWLLGRGYSEPAALKLVGDRFQLTARQRNAVMRGAASDQACATRRATRLAPGAMAGRALGIDTFNCLITIEASLSGGLVLTGRDGVLRDIASVHGTYRKVEETLPALTLLFTALCELRVGSVRFYLDRPVGNSGRLAALIGEQFRAAPFTVESRLIDAVDRTLVADELVVASSDSWVLDHALAWFDLPAYVCELNRLTPFHLDLSQSPAPLLKN